MQCSLQATISGYIPTYIPYILTYIHSQKKTGAGSAAAVRGYLDFHEGGSATPRTRRAGSCGSRGPESVARGLPYNTYFINCLSLFRVSAGFAGFSRNPLVGCKHWHPDPRMAIFCFFRAIPPDIIHNSEQMACSHDTPRSVAIVTTNATVGSSSICCCSSGSGSRRRSCSSSSSTGTTTITITTLLSPLPLMRILSLATPIDVFLPILFLRPLRSLLTAFQQSNASLPLVYAALRLTHSVPLPRRPQVLRILLQRCVWLP